MDMPTRKLLLQVEDVANFVHTLRTLWRDEPWEEVEPFAERAWNRVSAISDGRPWQSVRDFVKETWSLDEATG